MPLYITTVYFSYMKSRVKKEVKRQMIAGLDKSQLTLLCFTLDETQSKLKWEHPGEFEYEGFMYDIVESDTIGNRVTYWCWKDYEESELNDSLDELADMAMNNNPLQKENRNHLQQFLKSLYFDTGSSVDCIVSSTENHYIPFRESWNSLSEPPPTPPPIVC